MVKQLDPSRLVISASGWHDTGKGDVRSLHLYSDELKVEHDGKRPCVLGECGALGLVVPGHQWGGVGYWNITYSRNADELWKKYQGLIRKIRVLKEEKGLAAAVITQLTDVETELDGFMTFDRKVIKLPLQEVFELNSRLIEGN